MSRYHLRLLIQKSARYAWRRRICRCCPKIIFELFIPITCILLLCLLRWMHTPSSTAKQQTGSQSTHMQITPTSIVAQQDPIRILNYTSEYRCPPPAMRVEVVSEQLLTRFKRLCRRSTFILSSGQFGGHVLLNTSAGRHHISYRCAYDKQHWCWHTDLLHKELDSLQIQHRSASLCSHLNTQGYGLLLKAHLATESLLNPPLTQQRLLAYTWPCSSYFSDAMFSDFPRFIFIIVLILLDGCILFSFNFLFQELIEEKHQGVTELLRLLSVRPLLNSLAWFLRVFILQLLISVLLILLWKISFGGQAYLAYVSIWLIAPSILLWTVQVLSRSILVAHVFSNVLKASLWSWLVYFGSFWLAVSSSVRIPMVLHLVASTWLPFYAIKRLFVLFLQINTDLGRRTYLINEIILVWMSMILGSLLFWLLAFYFEQIRPGKYGIARPWSWPLDTIRHKRARRDSANVGIVEIPSNQHTTVRINHLTKTYGRKGAERQVAVDHVSFTLENSTIHGLIGHNGAGKTTTMEMICGLLACDSGTIDIHEKNLSENLPELQSCIGYCPQQNMLFAYLTVREQLEFYAHVRSKGKPTDGKQIQELLAMMDMDQFNQQLCHTLSGGMQRKLSIVCAFVGQANVIILDEPSSSLDPVARRTLWTWLREYKTNRTLLISSHLLDEVEELCDSVIILDSGRVRAQGTILELKQKYGPSGDRLHLDIIPAYIPRDWIIDKTNHYIQVPTRKRLIETLERLQRDNVSYSLMNVTLDDIFLKLTTAAESVSVDEPIVRSQIEALFSARTSTERKHLWPQQILSVLIRRGQVLRRRARLLPVVVVLYLIYALVPLYLPSLTRSSETIRYIVSSPPEYIDKLNLRNYDMKLAPPAHSSREFQDYLLAIPTWLSNHHRRRSLIGLRIISSDQMECYVPPPALANFITSCLPLFSIFSNRTISPLQLISTVNPNLFSLSSDTRTLQDQSPFLCLHTLPPTLHLSIFLLSLILIVCAALVIQDHASGLHSYSLVHGLRSPIHWSITFLSDLILCLLWLSILTFIARFAHSSTFNGRFFALTPLFFIVNLPFVYLLAKLFKAPVLGATVIIFILQFAHVLNTFKTFIELFHSFPLWVFLVRIIRWVLVLLFPNVNVFVLIVAVLRTSQCPVDDSLLHSEDKEFSHERYPKKILIHTVILIAQFVVYFVLLILLDVWNVRIPKCKVVDNIEQQDEDEDITEERHRIASMTDEDRQKQALVVDNLTKCYRGSELPAVNRLTFAVPHRQCFGLLGFNGSEIVVYGRAREVLHKKSGIAFTKIRQRDLSKTTTFRMLVRELQSSRGHIYGNRPETIGYCPQDDITFSALTVIQSIDYICRLHGLQPGTLNNLVLTQFQLEQYRHRLVSNLSGGTQRRLHLALCLIGSPTLLLLDEPTAKVDPVLRSHIRLLLQHRPADTSIIFASHSMLECEQLCDRLTILVRGNARCLGSLQHLKNKYGTNYRIRLTSLQPSLQIPSLIYADDYIEYQYPKGNLAHLFTILEELVEEKQIASNYTVQLTSLEHIFLTFQHSP